MHSACASPAILDRLQEGAGENRLNEEEEEEEEEEREMGSPSVSRQEAGWNKVEWA